MITNNVETKQILSAENVLEALTNLEAETLTTNKLTLPVGDSNPTGAEVKEIKAAVSEIVPTKGRVMIMPYPHYPAYPGYYHKGAYPGYPGFAPVPYEKP